jgi:hypothetical protein
MVCSNKKFSFTSYYIRDMKIKVNKSYSKPTSESMKDYKMRKPWYSMERKTISVKFPKAK